MPGWLWCHRNRGTLHPRHRHAELEFNLVIRGSGTYLVGDRRFEFRRNDLLWLFPGQEHILIDMSADFSMWVAVFRPELVESACAGTADTAVLCEDDPSGHFCRRLADPQGARLGALFDELLAAASDPPRYRAGISYALLAAWSAFASGEPIPPGASVHPAVERAAHLLRHDDSLDLEALARKTGLSTGRLSRLFKQQIGLPLAEYRNRLRIERFLAARPGSDDSMLDAALAAGFGSYPQFHRVFKRVMGCGPAAYERRR
jgi:AraC-like DNA-binding protein